ncbi:MAG: Asp-tRNA(Asn)/Glu-tRNA(Gln) amidotransferase subunit GatB, partial [Endomicrobium sp.]|nr:Asp-tRNA(Asn)/Glu-tRNA(Gln) amidotransferase subunit GatB [Endomicrobium sp.]
MIDYESVIGLEVHMQINTKSKVFCECSTKFGAKPNSNTCAICTSQPGTIPILNKKAVESVIKTGLALNSVINKKSIFARKHYFYPDSPKNYQITQYEFPLCLNGSLSIITKDGNEKKINISRIHLEEDAGKLLHEIGNKKLNYSLLDLNRAGIGLMELVTEPELRSPEEVLSFLNELKSIVEYLGTSECNMEEGKMRCDVNVSVRRFTQKDFGTKVEIKNINSLSGIRDAITYEIERQKKILSLGEKLIQETRLWKADKKITKSMRSKEKALDYRYFPEPDLTPLELTDSFINELKKEIPELPRKRRMRFIKDYGLTEYSASYITSTKAIADYYEETLKYFEDKQSSSVLLANWISTELNARLDISKISDLEFPVSSRNLARLIFLILNNTISIKIAKIIFDEMIEKSCDPQKIIDKKKLTQISDELTIV